MDWIVENILQNDYLINWLSAIGTIGAVWVALWLAKDKTIDEPITISIFDIKENKVNQTDYNPEIGEYVDVQGRYEITYEGSILLYNPSDSPKSLYDIKIIMEYEENTKGNKIKNEEGKEVKYITLKPKDLVVLNYNFTEQDMNVEGYPIKSIIPYSMFIVGKTEESEITKKEIELKNKKTPT